MALKKIMKVIGLEKLNEAREQVFQQLTSSDKNQRIDYEVFYRSELLDASYNLIDDFFQIGPNGTKVSREFITSMKWHDANKATKKLLTTLFDRNTLASHNLCGNSSSTFVEINYLDPKIIEDIIYIVTTLSKVSEKEVNQAIINKCADENRTLKRLAKKQAEDAERIKVSVYQIHENNTKYHVDNQAENLNISTLT